MGHRRDFEIAFVGLKPGIHEYNYEINDRFFEVFQQQDFRHCKANVKLTLDKNNGFMRTNNNFSINPAARIGVMYISNDRTFSISGSVSVSRSSYYGYSPIYAPANPHVQ